MENQEYTFPEIRTCVNCGREFVIDGEAIGNPIFSDFCPNCQSPHLFEDD